MVFYQFCLVSFLSLIFFNTKSYAEVCFQNKTSTEYSFYQQKYGHTCSMVGPFSQSDSFSFCCSGPDVSQQPKAAQQPAQQAGSNSQIVESPSSQLQRQPRLQPPPSGRTPRAGSSSQGSQTSNGENISNYKGEIKGNYQPGNLETGNSTQSATTNNGNVELCNSNSPYPTFYKKFDTIDESEKFRQLNSGKCNANGSGDGYVACCVAGYNPKDADAEEQQACSELVEESKKCEEDGKAAEGRCDPNSGDLGPYINGMRAGNMFGTQAMGMTMGIQGVCEKAAGLMTGLNTALAAFQGMCESSRNSCITSCQGVLKKMQSCPGAQFLQESKSIAEKNSKDCRAYGNRLNEAAQSVDMAMGSFQQAQRCAAMTKAMNMTVCMQNPFAPGCAGRAQTCNDPAFAATNPVCLGLKNPGGNTAQATIPVPGGSGALPDLKSSGFTGENIGSGLDTLGDALAGGVGGPGAPVGEDPGGKKGSGAPLNPNGGGGQGGGAGGGQGGGYDQEKIQVYSGSYGSGGAGAFGGARGAYGTAGNRYPGNATGTGTAFDKFNPAMAGMSRNSGLTGPNGSTIWQKVSNRYKAKEHSMKGVAP